MVPGMAPRKGLFIDHAKAVAITKEYAENTTCTSIPMKAYLAAPTAGDYFQPETGEP